MATIENSYTGDGSTVLFSFTFEYIEQVDVEVSIDSVTLATTEYSLANSTTIEFNTAPVSGAAIRIYRNTTVNNPKATFFPGSAIRAQDLNDNFEQILFVTQEADAISERAELAADQAQIATTAALAASATATTAATSAQAAASTAQAQVNAAQTAASNASTDANTAVTTANSAVATANSALVEAGIASTNATASGASAAAAATQANSASASAASAQSDAATALAQASSAAGSATAAQTSANTASSQASSAAADAVTAVSDAAAAVSTANTASSDASTALTAANNAVSTANAATATANTASTNAASAVTTANTASTNAGNALTTANTAASDAASALTTANSAQTDATAAVSTANTADTNASSAVTTAGTASTNATTAVNTANGATTTANSASTDAATAVSDAASAITTANSAATNAGTAISTANSASTTAAGAVTAANAAQSTANGAVSTANSATTTANNAASLAQTAASTVASSYLFTPVAAVANIPSNPSNNDAVRVSNSTNIESTSSVQNVPSGFVGDAGINVEILYSSSAGKWNYIAYNANDPDDRYGYPPYVDVTRQNTVDAATLSGVALNSTHLGTFTGSTIADSSTVKTALQSLETEVETKADLVGGVVPTSQLPALSITEFLGTVANQTAMLALTGQRGDFAIRSDTGSTFVLTSDGGSSLSHWQELATPTDSIQTVNGQSGTVVLGPSDVGAVSAASGGTFSGTVEIGTGIDLDTNGNATFGGLLKVERSSGGDQIFMGKQGSTVTSTLTADSWLRLGGSFSSNTGNNVSIKGSDGSASFAAGGTGINFGDWNSSTGHVFYAGGAYKVRRNDSNAAIQVFQNGTTTSDIKAQIKADGSVEFAGQITTNVNSGKFLEQYYSGTKVVQWDADGVLKIGGTPASAPNIKFNANGSADFASNITVADGNNTTASTAGGVFIGYTGYVTTVRPQSSTSTVFNAYQGATQTVNINAAGNATFAGNLTVSGTVDSRDVAADGTKLDGIESGATADQSAAEIRNLVNAASDSNVLTDALKNKLNAIEANATGDQTKAEIDALGINANTLDTYTSSDFLLSGSSDTASGDITFSGGAGAINISGGSDIRFTTGAWTGEHAGKIQYHDNDFYFQAQKNWYFRNSSGTTRMLVDGSGNLTATGNVTAYSDIRLKKDIEVIPHALDKVLSLRGVTYTDKETEDRRTGVIAQDVQAVLPEAVMEGEEYLSVAYGNLVGLLIESIKELEARVSELELL